MDDRGEIDMDLGAKILIVEDNDDLRDSIVEYLVLAGFRAAGVATAAAFYKNMGAEEWDIAVIDLGLPDQSGYVLVEYIHSNTTMKIIILTARNTLDDRIKGYDSGADIFLAKPVDCRELTAVINSLMLRRENKTPSMPDNHPARTASSQEIWYIDIGAWNLIAPDGAVISLTAKEVNFLKLLATTPSTTTAPLSRDSLLMSLYNRHDFYTSRALDSLVRRIRNKISLATTHPHPIKTIHSQGYCVSADLRLL